MIRIGVFVHFFANFEKLHFLLFFMVKLVGTKVDAKYGALIQLLHEMPIKSVGKALLFTSRDNSWEM